MAIERDLNEIFSREFFFLCVKPFRLLMHWNDTCIYYVFSAPVAYVTIYFTKYGGTEMSSALHS